MLTCFRCSMFLYKPSLHVYSSIPRYNMCILLYMMNICLTDCKIQLLFSHCESVFLCLEKVKDRGRRERLKEPRERTGDFYQMQWFDAGERPVRMYSCFSYFSPITGGGAYSYRVQKNFHPTFNTSKSAEMLPSFRWTYTLNIWSSTQQSTAMVTQQTCAIELRWLPRFPFKRAVRC